MNNFKYTDKETGEQKQRYNIRWDDKRKNIMFQDNKTGKKASCYVLSNVYKVPMRKEHLEKDFARNGNAKM